MKKIIFFLMLIISANLAAQDFVYSIYPPKFEYDDLVLRGKYFSWPTEDSIKVPKSLIEQISKYLPTVQNKQITNPIDLSSVRTAGIYAFSVESGGLGRRLLLNLQNSPYDEKYYMKGIRVDPAVLAEIHINNEGEQIIVFKKK